MPAAAIPHNEMRRLASLHALNIIDGDDEGVFRAFTRLASSLIDAPIAALTLIDADRQWIRAAEGLDIRYTPRTHAFCAHAILNPGEVTVVEDAREDPRFADNPLVTGEPGLRFYAGAPVEVEPGLPLGTLCVVDHRPREFTARERAQLADLAAGASSALQLHGALQRMGQANRTDMLTGAASRTALHAAMCRLANKPPAETGVAVFMTDMDGFKRINDTHGHAAGDAALREVTRRLQAILRPGDMVARLGGDEFVLLCHGVEHRAALAAIARRIHAAMAEPHAWDGVGISLRLSLGSAVLPWDGVNPDGLLAQADAALYQQKQSRRAGDTDKSLAAASGVPVAA
jgi:diguanylate cyclase (GGDEF)-like protein